MQPLVVLTLATDLTPYALNLAGSLRKHRYRFEIVGVGEKWEGFQTKSIEYRKAVARLAENDDACLVLLADSSDIIARGGPEQVINAYNATCGNGEVLFGAEFKPLGIDTRNPRTDGWRRVQRIPARLSLNSGVIAGPIGSVRRMLDWIVLNHGRENDQTACALYAEAFPDRVKLDCDRRLVDNCMTLDMMLAAPQLTFGKCDRAPPLFHAFALENSLWKTYRYNQEAKRQIGVAATYPYRIRCTHVAFLLVAVMTVALVTAKCCSGKKKD